ncbi:ABC transporter substrate-binding protein [Inquilinus limosus]|uniref:ABC transporter substrate-binding protein n=1 Tax=Inquilinus limosus TaxID=171674 RepID=UPI003F18CAE5
MRSVLSFLAAAALSFIAGTAAAAGDKITVTDLAGRTVEVPRKVERILLGEGRQIYIVAALDRENPIGRIAGWKDEFERSDLDTYRLYQAKFPGIDAIPDIGDPEEGTFNTEQALALKPDVLFLLLGQKPAAEESGLIKTLEGAGIATVFIDFRDEPFTNTEPSVRLFGEILGRQDRAEEFIAFFRQQMDLVQDRLARSDAPKPKVMIERAAGTGWGAECCASFGDNNFGRMVRMAGGINIAADLIPGTFGVLNPEQVTVANPDVVIATGANWSQFVPDGGWVGLGPGADQAKAKDRLAALVRRPAYTGVKAVAEGRVHAIWHQFYDSPYQFVGVQQIAKWLHPDLFADLDPEATFRALHERFLPIPYQPGYWVSLSPAG